MNKHLRRVQFCVIAMIGVAMAIAYGSPASAAGPLDYSARAGRGDRAAFGADESVGA